MSLDKTYNPKTYEPDIYKMWEQSGAFTANVSSDKPPFTISMPPPNETGTLSLGHALFLTLQDITARYQRQQGKDVLWLPGTDHAALAVNAIIEKKLAEEESDKHQIGREAFIAKTKEFVGSSRETMLGQMRAMGASADWSRLRYTLDPALNRCVNETFIKMYNDGLIYRGARIVNWDPNLQTSISDDEVEYKEETTSFYTFKYGPFEIGTARPETKFGDKCVVMHPDDERYAHYKHGDTFETEWINGPITATIIKDEAIDPEFGTGVMTITPWHSAVDFEIAERHGLEKEQIIDENGRLMAIAQEFEGMPISEARSKIVEKLNSKGLLVKEDKNYVHKIAINERGKGVIEPQIKLQWWVDVNRPVVEWNGTKRSLKEILQSVINDGDIKIIPSRFNKTYFHWIDNLRDWCISRQIWWGHQVPAWYKGDEIFVGNTAPEGDGWTRDPDTLDTWFSSALWTWSTLIDQDLAEDYKLSINDLLAKSPDFQKYHPTSLMETGWDILFFWVARMILSTTYMTGQIPFKDVYLHGMVRAEDGKKMSKSRPESIIDPLHVIDEFGTDALRMGLIMGISPGNDQSWSKGRIEANRNFCNKIWNIARYIEGSLGESLDLSASPTPETLSDHWILAQINEAKGYIEKQLDAYAFSEAYNKLYHMIWDDLADWYIEASKSAPNASVLNYSLATILKLAHPFAPFVTEAIWQNLGGEGMLISTPWPNNSDYDNQKAQQFVTIQSIVSEIRVIKADLNLQKGSLGHTDDNLIDENQDLIAKLANLDSIVAGEFASGVKTTIPGHECWIILDIEQAKNYKESLVSKLENINKQISGLESRLNNQSYVEKAPSHLVEESKAQVEILRAQKEKVSTQLEQI